MTYVQVKKLLKDNDQAQLLRFWETLTAADRKALLAQIAALDFESIGRMQAMLAAKDMPATAPGADLEAAEVIELRGKARADAIAAGEKELKSGRVAVLLVAGGQGSRLGFNGPKGAFPIGPLSNEPLFFFHARKVLGLSKRYGIRVPFYIMTSDVNDEATRRHFVEHSYFGLDPADVIFFRQGVWPALNGDGKIILDAPNHIFMSPDGHGGTLAALKNNGCLANMAKRGIEEIFYFQVDNPLVEIGDPAFIGLHALRHADISLKLCAKREATEGMGVVAKCGGKFRMIEYTELTTEQANRQTASGDLYFKYGSPAIHVFSRAFLETEAAKAMPLHLAHKKIPICQDDGTVVKPTEPNGYKFEKFIFDVLPDAKTVVNLAFDRADEFSPVKNAEGKDSPASCKQDLQAKWRRQLAAAGLAVPADMGVEIDPVYAVNGEALAKKGLSIR